MQHHFHLPPWLKEPDIVGRILFFVSLVLTLAVVAAFCHGPVASAEESDAAVRPVLRIGILRPAGAGNLADTLARSQELGLTELSKYTDWDYEPVSVTMADAAARLAMGDIDLLLPAPPSLAADAASYAVTRPLALRDRSARSARGWQHRPSARHGSGRGERRIVRDRL